MFDELSVGPPDAVYLDEARADTYIDDRRRWVGDALIWSDGTTTYRLETALGRAAALDLAGSIAGAVPP